MANELEHRRSEAQARLERARQACLDSTREVATWRAAVQRAERALQEKQKQLWDNYHRRESVAKIDQMSGHEFERFLGRLLAKQGHQDIELTPTNDFGADIICASDRGTRIVIQAKRRQKSVGISAVQQVLGAKSCYNCNEAWVITSSTFTESAVALAKTANVLLRDRSWVDSEIEKHFSEEPPPFDSAAFSTVKELTTACRGERLAMESACQRLKGVELTFHERASELAAATTELERFTRMLEDCERAWQHAECPHCRRGMKIPNGEKQRYLRCRNCEEIVCFDPSSHSARSSKASNRGSAPTDETCRKASTAERDTTAQRQPSKDTLPPIEFELTPPDDVAQVMFWVAVVCFALFWMARSGELTVWMASTGGESSKPAQKAFRSMTPTREPRFSTPPDRRASPTVELPQTFAEHLPEPLPHAPVTVKGEEDAVGGAIDDNVTHSATETDSSQRRGNDFFEIRRPQTNAYGGEYRRHANGQESVAPVAPEIRLKPVSEPPPDDASASFQETFGAALHRFWEDDFEAAKERFESAREHSPSNAAPFYFLALLYAQQGRMQQAEAELLRAIEVERATPVENWGAIMERVQGKHRLWLEDARIAGLSRERELVSGRSVSDQP